MATENMMFFWGSGSGPCWKPMIVFAEKKIWNKDMNTMIQFSKKEHKEGEILKLNPRGQVPTFRDDDVVVNESMAICLYLEEKYCDPAKNCMLLPSDLKKRASVYQRMVESNNMQSIIMEKLVYYKWRTKEEDRDEKYLKEHTDNARTELGRWNTILENQTYLCGDTFTMADVFFFPYVAFLVRSGGTLSDFAELKRYYDTIKERPSIKETWPPHWNESEGSKILTDL